MLTDLFQAYYDARRHKRNTRSQLQFEVDMERNLVGLYHELRDRTYRPGSSICFVVDEPVKREVFASSFRDRVVHHLYFNYVSPIFERAFIFDSYSCRRGKGTLMGIERLEHHIRSCTRNFTREAYVLKLDISGYFMSIDRGRLCRMALDMLERYRCRPAPGGGTWEQWVDYDLVRFLTRAITSKNPLEGCRIRGSRSRWEGLPDSKCLSKSPAGVGMPIGDLTSQLFSNLFLNTLDQYVKRELRFAHYGRYVDDFYIVDTDRSRLRRAIGRIRGLLQQLGLRLHPKKVVLVRAVQSIAFLGAVCRPRRRCMSLRTQAALRRCLLRLRRLSDSLPSPPQSPSSWLAALRARLVSLLSYVGYMGHFQSLKWCC